MDGKRKVSRHHDFAQVRRIDLQLCRANSDGPIWAISDCRDSEIFAATDFGISCREFSSSYFREMPIHDANCGLPNLPTVTINSSNNVGAFGSAPYSIEVFLSIPRKNCSSRAIRFCILRELEKNSPANEGRAPAALPGRPRTADQLAEKDIGQPDRRGIETIVSTKGWKWVEFFQ
jgi:hypothetical protein